FAAMTLKQFDRVDCEQAVKILFADHPVDDLATLELASDPLRADFGFRDEGRQARRDAAKMTPEDQKNLLASIGTFVRREIAAATEPLRHEIDALKRKQREFRYCGVWVERTPYYEGNFCTWDGSLWHCNINGVETKPGKDPVAWTLCVKRG